MSTRKPASVVEAVAVAVASAIGFVTALVFATHVVGQHWGPLVEFGTCLLVMAGTAIVIVRIWRRLRGGR